jgi:hypothetical protein
MAETRALAHAQGYVENMLGATQEQLFSGTRGPDVTNPETGEVTQGNFNITGFKPYQAYGGTYDAQGNQLSYDPSKGIAKINPMQANAYNNVQGMQFDPTRYNLAQLGAEAAGRGGLSSAQTALNYGTQGSLAGQKGQELGIAGGQNAIYDANRYAKSGFESGIITLNCTTLSSSL